MSFRKQLAVQGPQVSPVGFLSPSCGDIPEGGLKGDGGGKRGSQLGVENIRN